MNAGRAKQISESAGHYEVFYEGKSVYIQHVDEDNSTARVYPVDQPEHEMEVSLESLTEK